MSCASSRSSSTRRCRRSEPRGQGPPRLNSRTPFADIRENSRIDAAEGAGARIVDEDRISDARRIEAVAHEIDLAQLERARRFEMFLESQEPRPRIIGQVRLKMRAERGEIEGADIWHGERHHAGAAFLVSANDTVQSFLAS